MKQSYLLTGLSALLATTAISAAHADDERWPRWYLGLSGGYTYMADQDVSGGVNSPDKMSLNNGFGLGASIGLLPTSSIPLINMLRFEAEITYHENGIDDISHRVAPASTKGSGHFSSTAYMANVFYDLPTNSPWSPYIGGGIGLATVNLSGNSGLSNTESSDTEFAYQGLIGVGYSPESIPNTQWTLGYRYLATLDPSYSTPGGDVKSQYSTHSLEVGAKFRF